MLLRFKVPLIYLVLYFLLFPFGVLSLMISFPANFFVMRVAQGYGYTGDVVWPFMILGSVIQYFLLGYLLEWLIKIFRS
jgi:hypothetical protein